MQEINFTRFKVKNPDYTYAFEQLCYHLFCRSLKVTEGVRADFNQAGLETRPVLYKGKYYGFQSKFFDSAIDGKQIEASIEKALQSFPANLHVIYIYLNHPIGLKAKYDKKIEALAAKKNVTIEWKVPSHFEAMLSKPANLDLAQFYFGVSDEISFLYSNLDVVNRTVLQSSTYIPLPVKGLPPKTKLALSVQKARQKIVLLSGDPGGGKTLMVQSLFLEYSGMNKSSKQQMLNYLHTHKTLPMLVNLRDCGEESLENIIRNRLQDYELKAKDKDLVYIFDGLDELTLEKAEKAIDYCNNLASGPKTKKIIISCRLMNPNRVLCTTTFTDLQEYIIDELKPAHLKKYFTVKNHSGKQGLLKSLLITNPDLLKEVKDIFLVTLLWDAIETLNQSSTIIDLFHLKVQALLNDARYRKNLQSLNLLDPKKEKIIELNRQIAFQLQKTSEYRFSKTRVQALIEAAYPKLDYKSINEICDYLSSFFFSQGTASGDTMFMYGHRMYQDYFFSLQLRQEYEADKKSIRPFLSNQALFDSLFLTYLRSVYDKENNLVRSMEVNLYDVYLGKHPGYGADDFHFYDSLSFIQAISGFPEKIVEALRSDPLTNLEEKVLANPRNIVILYAAGKKSYAQDLLDQLDKQIENSKKSKDEQEQNKVNALLYEQLEHWRYVQIFVKKIPITELLDRIRKANQDKQFNAKSFQSIWQAVLSFDPGLLIPLISTLSIPEFETLAELISSPAYIHIFIKQESIQKTVKEYLAAHRPAINTTNLYLLTFKKILQLKISSREKELAEKEWQLLSAERDFDISFRNYLKRFSSIAFVLNKYSNATIATVHEGAARQSQVYAALYRDYMEMLQGKLTLKQIINSWKKAELKLPKHRVSSLDSALSQLLAIAFSEADATTTQLKEAKEIVKDGKSFRAIVFFEGIVRRNKISIAVLVNEEEVDEQADVLNHWQEEYSTAAEYAFQLARLYANFSTEKAKSLLLQGINLGILRHGWRKDSIVSHGLASALDIAWQNNWFSKTELNRFAEHCFDMALKLRHITDGKGTFKAPYNFLDVIIAHNASLAQQLLPKLSDSGSDSDRVYHNYFEIQIKIKSGAPFNEIMKVLEDNGGYRFIRTDPDSASEFVFGLYLKLALNDFYTEEQKATAFHAALNVLENIAESKQFFSWLGKEEIDDFIRLATKYDATAYTQRAVFQNYRKPAKDEEFMQRLQQVKDVKGLEVLYVELKDHEREWKLAQKTTWSQLVQVTYQLTGSIQHLLSLMKRDHYPHSDFFSYNASYYHFAMAVALHNPYTANEMINYLRKESGQLGFLNTIRAAEAMGDRELGRQLFQGFYSCCDFLVN
jgi:hypothetical protein